jgi:hypothetical protein
VDVQFFLMAKEEFCMQRKYGEHKAYDSICYKEKMISIIPSAYKLSLSR